MEKIYNTVAALVFVMDRFSYWQGSSNRTLDLVDYLKSNSPDTPIAPQLLIRKARVMKNAGNLHGRKVISIFNYLMSSGSIGWAKLIKLGIPLNYWMEALDWALEGSERHSSIHGY